MYLFLVPLIGFFVFKAAFGIMLYRVRVPCSWKDTLAASVASMGLSHAIARGIFLGLWRKKGEFVRTAKSRRIGKKPNPFASVQRGTADVPRAGRRHRRHDQLDSACNYIEGRLWIAILAAQAIPYASALIGAWVAHRSGEAVG